MYTHTTAAKSRNKAQKAKSTHAHIYARMLAHTHAHTHIHIHTRARARVQRQNGSLLNRSTHTYTHTHTHTHTHTEKITKRQEEKKKKLYKTSQTLGRQTKDKTLSSQVHDENKASIRIARADLLPALHNRNCTRMHLRRNLSTNKPCPWARILICDRLPFAEG